MSCHFRLATRVLMLFVWFAFGRVSPAQDAPQASDPVLAALESRISSFLEGVSAGEPRTAYEELLGGSQLIKQEKALQQLIDNTEALQGQYGRYCGFEQVAAKRIGTDLVLLKYLYKCENFPVVWRFTFYRTPLPGETPAKKGPWRVIAVRFDTELELLAL